MSLSLFILHLTAFECSFSWRHSVVERPPLLLFPRLLAACLVNGITNLLHHTAAAAAAASTIVAVALVSLTRLADRSERAT